MRSQRRRRFDYHGTRRIPADVGIKHDLRDNSAVGNGHFANEGTRNPPTIGEPAGLIDVTAQRKNGKVTCVTFRNVPAFTVYLDATIDVPGVGPAVIDVAWGGMWFVLADCVQFGLNPTSENGVALTRLSEALRHAAREQLPVAHSDNPEIIGPIISNLYAEPITPDTQGRGAVIISTGPYNPARPDLVKGILDRSACGTGTCAKMAVLHAKGQLDIGSDYINAGPLGTTFKGRIEATTKVGSYDAIIPSLSGQGWIYGSSQYYLDPSDPFQQGYRIGDIWG